MGTRIVNLILIIGLSLLLTTCGDDDGGGGNGKRGAADLSGALVEVSVGDHHACAVLDTGKLVCWGGNGQRQLGTGNTANSATPVEVDLGEGQTAVAVGTGDNHTCAILEDGSLLCWGDNGYGQLGDGTTTNRSAPVSVDIGDNRTAVGISLGDLYTCALLDDGSLKCWGINTSGQLGDYTKDNRHNPTPVKLGSGVKARALSGGDTHTCAILTDDTVSCWGASVSNPSPVALEAQRTAKAISSGNRYSCAVLDDDSLACWGENTYGQLGVGDNNLRGTPTNVELGEGRTAVAVSSAAYHTCALLDDNSVKCWGRNDFGQLGDETIVNKNSPANVDLGDKRVAAIRAGGSTSCALFEDGSLTCWGSNEDGQLGTGESGLSILSPQTVDTGDETVTAIDGGDGHSCAFFEDSQSNTTFECWGWNDSGQLGDGNELNRLTPFGVVANTIPDQFSLGGEHTCAIFTSIGIQSIGCWGENENGQLGNGNTTDQRNPSSVNLGTGKTPKAVSAGDEHTCAIDSDDKIKCWGEGGSGRLGGGLSIDQNSPVAVSMSSNTATKISAGGKHTCAIFDDDKVYCWGENNTGQLGIGSRVNSNTPLVVNLGTDGDNNAYTATAINTGNNHTCVILNNNSVKCWGNNSFGQLGDGSKARRTSPVAVNLGTNRTATAIHAKGDYTCAILDNGSLKCWGLNRIGQLGDGTTTNRTTPTAVDLGDGRTATAVAGGTAHTCAILDDESLKCWGLNDYGQTGIPTVHRGEQAGEMGDNLIFVDLGV